MIESLADRLGFARSRVELLVPLYVIFLPLRETFRASHSLQLDEVVALCGQAAGLGLPAGERHAFLRDGLSALYLQRVARLECQLQRKQILDMLEMDIELNAQGLGVWMDAKR